MTARIIVVCLSILLSIPALAGVKVHTVVKGDTLWDLSGHYWQDNFSWPLMWSHNGQIYNPHWIYPGDKVYLVKQEPGERKIVLPIETLEPPAPVVEIPPPPEPEVKRFAVLERRGQDYLNPGPEARMGEVDNPSERVYWALGEEIELKLANGAKLRAGDMATLFDDSRLLEHPTVEGRVENHVHILGHVIVRKVIGDRAIGFVRVSYDAIPNGSGVMAYRERIKSVPLSGAPKKIEGVVYGGDEPVQLYSESDAVFLDKGAAEGLEPGNLVEIPVGMGSSLADEGQVFSIEKPIARLVIVSVEENAATGVIARSRSSVMAGQRFVTASFSP